MAARIKLKKKNKNNKEPSRQYLWPDLPEQLICKIKKQPLLYRSIFGRGVTESWRVDKCMSNSTQLPWLQLTFDHEVADPKNKRPQRFHVLGCYGGLLVLIRYHWFPFVIQNLISGGVCYLAPWDTNYPFIYGASSSSSSSKFRYVIVLTGISSPAFAFGRILKCETKDWIFKDSSIVDPHGKGNNFFLQFSNGIWFEGKFYALNLQGTLAVTEQDNVDSNDLRITNLSKKRALPSDLSSAKHFREYLIESEGKILLVFLISRSSIHKVDSAEVYHVETDKLTWIKRDSLGDVTLFLGADCCISVSASRIDCRGNCICFTHGNSIDGWWVYDMETAAITPEWISVSKSSIWTEEALLE